MLQYYKVCVRSIVEVNVLAEAISAKVLWGIPLRFLPFYRSIEILTNFYGCFVIHICKKIM